MSGPLLSVSTPASQQNRFAAVHLLTGQSLYFIVEVSVCVKKKKNYFYIMYTIDGEEEKSRKNARGRECFDF